MKFKVLSDLHIEFEPFTYEYSGEDAVVLAGDIATTAEDIKALAQQIDVPILYVPGNHEFYRTNYVDMMEQLYEVEADVPNFNMLNNSSIEINGFSFYGGIMRSPLTSVETGDELPQDFADGHIELSIADFMRKYDHETRYSTEHHKEEFQKFCEGFDKWQKDVTPGKIKVCISHFIPTPKHIHPRFANQTMNRYFTADMSDYIRQVDMWFHGHGHDPFWNIIDGVLVTSNPKGYPNENNGFLPEIIVEL